MTYLDRLEALRIEPNFFCSEEYFRRSGWTPWEDDIYIGVKDEDGYCALPPLPKVGTDPDYIVPHFAGFPGGPIRSPLRFLDYEFIYEGFPGYDDINHLDRILLGGKWKSIRKNIHGVYRELGQNFFMGCNIPESDAEDLLIKWAEGRDDIFSPDTMTAYVLSGDNRAGIFRGPGRELFAILVWDSNYQYINFRYCVVRDIPGLSDFARIVFRAGTEKQINDGGALGNPGLERYKRKFNPVKINSIYSGFQPNPPE
jgi:hypothetical protein